MSKSNPGLSVEDVRQEFLDSWDPPAEDRARDFDRLMNRVLPEYAKALGVSEQKVWEAIEGKRSFSAPNYYQEHGFPVLTERVLVFDEREEMVAALQPERGFRCPMCKGITMDHVTCRSGKEMAKGQVCDWKAYGLFGTMGKGVRVLLKSEFLVEPMVHEIFMPVALESKTESEGKTDAA